MNTHTGWVHVAFIFDVFSRMVVGSKAAKLWRAELAIERSRRQRRLDDAPT